MKEKTTNYNFYYHNELYFLSLKVNTYPEGNLAIKLYCNADTSPDFWGSLTVNLPGMRPIDCAFINVQEYGNEILDWICQNQLATPTGQIRHQGNMEIPEFCFFSEKLYASDNDGYTYYSRRQKGELGRYYERLYIALRRLKKNSNSFHYIDYSGWRCLEDSADYLPLWIVAEDPTLHLRCTIIHNGIMMKLTTNSFDNAGIDLPNTTRNYYCRTKEDLATHLLKLFMPRHDSQPSTQGG